MSTDLDRAVAGTGRDAAVPWHYGDPLREQRRLATGAGVVDRRHRDVLVVPGADRLAGCTRSAPSTSPPSPTATRPRRSCCRRTGTSSSTGRSPNWTGRCGSTPSPATAPTVLDYLRKMQFLKRVEPADVSRRLGRAVPGRPGDADRPDASPGCRFRSAPGARSRSTGAVSSAAWPGRAPRPPTCSSRRDRTDASWPRSSTPAPTPAGLWAFEALRVEARRPRLGQETDHRTIPHEVGWIGPAVHLDKGCYRGQETVARVQNLGRPPRRLVLLHLSGESDELPAPGTPSSSPAAPSASWAPRCTTTSWARSPWPSSNARYPMRPNWT